MERIEENAKIVIILLEQLINKESNIETKNKVLLVLQVFHK